MKIFKIMFAHLFTATIDKWARNWPTQTGSTWLWSMDAHAGSTNAKMALRQSAVCWWCSVRRRRYSSLALAATCSAKLQLDGLRHGWFRFLRFLSSSWDYSDYWAYFHGPPQRLKFVPALAFQWVPHKIGHGNSTSTCQEWRKKLLASIIGQSHYIHYIPLWKYQLEPSVFMCSTCKTIRPLKCLSILFSQFRGFVLELHVQPIPERLIVGYCWSSFKMELWIHCRGIFPSEAVLINICLNIAFFGVFPMHWPNKYDELNLSTPTTSWLACLLAGLLARWLAGLLAYLLPSIS